MQKLPCARGRLEITYNLTSYVSVPFLRMMGVIPRAEGSWRDLQVVHKLGRHFGFQAFNAVPSTLVRSPSHAAGQAMP